MGVNNGRFKIMTSLPEKGNKFYNTTSNGGYSRCIQGSPVQSGRNVYSNCVGHACSRFNEVYSILTGYNGMKFPNLNCNAENFIERAKNTYGLEVKPYPVLGGIMVWQKGATLSGSDGAGHVAFVEDITAATNFYSSESGWGSSNPFWNSNRSNSNGRWGMSSGYTFRGCIVNPAIGDIHWGSETVTPNVDRDETKNQVEVKIDNLRVRTGAGTDQGIIGMAHKGIYNVYEQKDATGYTWYRIADKQWLATSEDWTTYLPKTKEPEPVPEWPKYHVVEKNDTLSGIAKKYYGNGDAKHYNFIAQANGIANPNIIHTGAKLTIPEYKETPAPTPTPTPSTGLKVGDTVKIVGTGYSNIYGTKGHAAGGIGWTRTILKVWDGKAYPYQVGNNTGTTGFYKASALEKK